MNAPLVRRSPVRTASVVATRSLTPRMQRVTIRTDALDATELRPAQDVELLLHEPTGRRVKRRYTIRSARPSGEPDLELDLDVLLHGAGPGSQWGRTASPGDPVDFQGPRGKLELRHAPCHLFVGDESALPAIATICEALPVDEPAQAIIEVQDGADELSVAAAVRWVHRGATPPATPPATPTGTPPGTPDLLRRALAAVVVPAGTLAYLMGESRAMIALRGVVEELGIEHDAIFVKGYWNVGRPDRIANRPPS